MKYYRAKEAKDTAMRLAVGIPAFTVQKTKDAPVLLVGMASRWRVKGERHTPCSPRIPPPLLLHFGGYERKEDGDSKRYPLSV